MLSPRVWNFESPSYKLFSLADTNLSKQTEEDICNHFFNHCVTVILPDTVVVPEDLNTSLTQDSIYYKVEQLSIRRFLNKQFINHFVQSGKLSALSVGTHIDTDDCAAVTPTGHLVLNLLKETYQSLGLEGTQSDFSTERYVMSL